METTDNKDHEPWPLRAFVLLGLGALFGLLFWLLTDGMDSRGDDPLEMAGATFVAVSEIVFAFSLERLRWEWSALFAAATGAVVALVGWLHGPPQDWGAGEGWQFFSSLIAVAIAVPLFQSARDYGAFRFDEKAVHAHVWTNLILGAAAVAFVGATFLLTLLLSELFRLIGIEILRDLLEDGWFAWMLGCGALGAAVGLLRDRARILVLLQRVATAVLSVLAPVFAAGLVLFVLALPFTGLEPLWSQTKQTTPILLVCILGAVVLANAVIGNGSEEEARSPILRWAALGLVGVMLPLAVVAAVSTGKQIGQYGFTPDRLWAAVFILVAAAFGAAYLYSCFRGRFAWPDRLRRSNIGLALGVCGLALFLALPILSFGAISARDQLARLQSGSIAPDKFDWAAMRFDFGPAGRRALERLAASGPPLVRRKAAEALKAENRWALMGEVMRPARINSGDLRLTTAGNAPVPPALRERIEQSSPCNLRCRLFYDTPERAVVVGITCPDCAPFVHVFVRRPDGAWQALGVGQELELPHPQRGEERFRAQARALESGRLEVRSVEKRQVFLDGEPVGPVFAP